MFYKKIRVKKGVFVLYRSKSGPIFKPLGGWWLGNAIGIVAKRRCFRCRFIPPQRRLSQGYV